MTCYFDRTTPGTSPALCRTSQLTKLLLCTVLIILVVVIAISSNIIALIAPSIGHVVCMHLKMAVQISFTFMPLSAQHNIRWLGGETRTLANHKPDQGCSNQGSCRFALCVAGLLCSELREFIYYLYSNVR